MPRSNKKRKAVPKVSRQPESQPQGNGVTAVESPAVPPNESWGSAACILVKGMRRLLLGGRDTTFSFSDLPREVRDKVYRYLLSITESLYGTFIWLSTHKHWRNNFPGLGLLGVNRQIRAEAWHVLVNDNAWISIRLCGGPQLFSHLLKSDSSIVVSGPRFFTESFSREMKHELWSAAVITLCLGSKSGIKRAEKQPGKEFGGFTQLLAFHPTIWRDIVNETAHQVDEQHSVHITCRRDVHLDTSTSGRAFEDIVKTMFVIRGVSRATVSGCGHCLDTLASSMATPIRSDADLLAIIGQVQDAGDDYLRQGNLRAAMKVYKQGYTASATFLAARILDGGSLPATPLGNSVHAAALGLLDSWAQALTGESEHLMKADGAKIPTSQLSLDSPPPGVVLVHTYRPGELLRTAFRLTSRCLKWPGVTDKQRRLSHWHRASIFSLAAELDEETVSKLLFKQSDCQMLAAKDYWYAMQIDGPDRDLLHRLYSDMCQAINRNSEEPFELQSIKVPALGDWVGDPRLLIAWGHHAVMMRLYRQRISPDLGETMDEQELRALYEHDGITWHRGPYGEIHFDGPGMPSWALDL